MATPTYVGGMDVYGSPIRLNNLEPAPAGITLYVVVCDSAGNLYRQEAS